MSKVEQGVIKSQLGFDYAVWGDTYGFGRSDFKRFDKNILPYLFVSNPRSESKPLVEIGTAVLFLSDGKVERTEAIDDLREADYSPTGELRSLTFKKAHEGINLEGLPLTPELLEQARRLIGAYQQDIAENGSVNSGFLEFIPV